MIFRVLYIPGIILGNIELFRGWQYFFDKYFFVFKYKQEWEEKGCKTRQFLLTEFIYEHCLKWGGGVKGMFK